MIVEPVPTEARTRRRRAMAVLRPLAPAALLVAVVAAAVLGRGAGPVPLPTQPPTAPAAAPPAVAAVPPASPEAVAPAPTPPDSYGGGLPDDVASPPPFPSEVAGLPVRTVQQLLGDVLGPTPSGRDAPVAVAGYLGIFDPPSGCNDPAGPLGALCDRVGVLTAVPWVMSGGAQFAGLGLHLHPQFPPGIPVPDDLARTATTPAGAPVPAVLIGRPRTSGASCDVDPGCEVRLIVDAVAWADGATRPVTAVVDPSIEGIPADWIAHDLASALRTLGTKDTTLGAMLVPTSHLGLFDPTAAAAAQLGRPTPGAMVWYVRVLDPRPDPRRLRLSAPGPHIEWAVLDASSYRVLATGVPDEADEN
jgi:hypothetical protein